MNQEYKGFFGQREEIADRISALDKEIYRLNSQREKLEEAINYQNTYMWEEYELTQRGAEKLRDPEYDNLDEMRRATSGVKDEIRRMGNVNVNAIEEYKEVSERYNFLKGQHDDLVEAEQTLMGIIDDLDEGMRKQFTGRFCRYPKESLIRHLKNSLAEARVHWNWSRVRISLRLASVSSHNRQARNCRI